MEGNDPCGGHGRVCEGDGACVGLSRGTVEVKQLCFRWLSPLFKLVSKICLGSGHLLCICCVGVFQVQYLP